MVVCLPISNCLPVPKEILFAFMLRMTGIVNLCFNPGASGISWYLRTRTIFTLEKQKKLAALNLIFHNSWCRKPWTVWFWVFSIFIVCLVCFVLNAIQLTGKQVKEYESRLLEWATMKYQELVCAWKFRIVA